MFEEIAIVWVEKLKVVQNKTDLISIMNKWYNDKRTKRSDSFVKPTYTWVDRNFYI